jgi:hypothetical protein
MSDAHLANAMTTGAPLTGQSKIAVTSTAVRLPDRRLVNGVIITAKSTNTTNILVGDFDVTTTQDGTGNGEILEPGASLSYAVDNLNRVWINGTAGAIISYSGS